MYIRNVNRIKEDIFYTQNKIPTNTQIFKENFHKDTVSISSGAQTLFTEKENLKEAIEINPIDDRNQSLIEFIDQLHMQSEEKDNSSNDLLKCIQIAMRIMSGHRVPVKDEKFLAETEPEMYLRAVMLRRENEDSKDYKSVLEEDPTEQITSQEVSMKSTSIESGEVSVSL